MRPITKAQRVALKRVFDRTPLLSRNLYPDAAKVDARAFINQSAGTIAARGFKGYSPVSYRQFRRSVNGPFYRNDPVIMVPWCGMWLGIEADGYVHS